MSNKHKPTFYTAFANSVEQQDFLPNLSEEAMKIADLLQKLTFDDRLYYIKDEIFSLDRLVLNFSKYGDLFDIFYFSGHGKDGCLQLSDNFKAGLMPMADVINQTLRNLQLGFFNACETFDLAKEIAVKRAKSKEAGTLVLIACRNEINSFLAERFATLFFTQIGQPGTYKDAYDQAKSLVCLMNSKVRFREFYSIDEITSADNDFDYAYMEITYGKPSAVKRSEKKTAKAAPPPPTSIIGNDDIMNDALTTNYINEVIKTISTSKVAPDQVKTLSDVLDTVQKVSQGKSVRNAEKIFKKAADELPGFSSSSAFQSLVNVEKHQDNPIVQSIIKNDKNTSVGSMVDLVSSIKF